MKRNNVFPFCAVIGQEDIKNALIFNAVNPAIGGVLISGEKGTAKSTLVRGLATALKDTEVVELPLNVTEDRLIGTIDIENAIKNGEKYLDPGILMKADGNILFVDEVNLLSEYIVNCLLEVSASHVNHIEREGISYAHKAEFVLIGTMNSEEGALRPQFLDRFGLYVEVKGCEQPEERKEIIRRRLDYEKNPEEYVRKWEEETEKLSDKINKAKQRLNRVKVSEEILKLASEISMEGNCAGHRAELTVIETVRAIAAFDNREYITVQDIKQAVRLALPHRLRQAPSRKHHEDEWDNQEDNSQDEKHDEWDQKNDRKKEEELQSSDREEDVRKTDANNGSSTGVHENQNNETGGNNEDDVEEPGNFFEIKPFNIETSDKRKRKGSGKRSRTKTDSLQGRYIRYTIPKGRLRDIAFDATLRAAAPYQKSRDLNGMAVSIRNSDLREKVREKRTGNTILFIVDASSSMGVRQRMKAVKGAILSILNDAYQKRDKVGMIAFRKDTAQLVLGITRSVDLAEKNLRELPTGGKTPLASGLYRGYEVIKAAKLKDPDIIPLIVLVSDGRANVSFNGGNPVEEAIIAAKRIKAEEIKALVIDTENDFIQLGMVAKIAEAMGAEYLKLDILGDREIKAAVKGLVAD